MRHDPERGGNLPGLGADALLATAAGLDSSADLEPIEWGLVPASHLTFAQVLDIGRVLADALSRPDVDGAVVVQGTDVIEETAFAWDLLPLPAKPVVVVGAMRSASEPEYDGPANLRASVAAASDPGLRDQGVVVVMAGEIHGADDVRKMHTHAFATFQSPNRGRLGAVDADGRVTLERRRRPSRLPRLPAAAALPVHLLTFALETDARLIQALAAPRPAALVVAAAGGGNTPPGFLELARRLMADEVPVGLTSRCPSGQPQPGYAFDGGSSQWWEAGAVFTGTLGPFKSRILLALGLGAGLSVAQLAALCEPFGGGRAS